MTLDCSQPLYLAHAKENASKAGWGVGFASEASKKRIEKIECCEQSTMTFFILTFYPHFHEAPCNRSFLCIHLDLNT